MSSADPTAPRYPPGAPALALRPGRPDEESESRIEELQETVRRQVGFGDEAYGPTGGQAKAVIRSIAGRDEHDRSAWGVRCQRLRDCEPAHVRKLDAQYYEVRSD